MPAGKRSFLKNAELLLRAKEKILNNFKNKIFPTKILCQHPNQQNLLNLNKKRTSKKSSSVLCRF